MNLWTSTSVPFFFLFPFFFSPVSIKKVLLNRLQMSSLIRSSEILWSLFTILHGAWQNTGPGLKAGHGSFWLVCKTVLLCIFSFPQRWSLNFQDASEYRYLFVGHVSHLQKGLICRKFYYESAQLLYCATSLCTLHFGRGCTCVVVGLLTHLAYTKYLKRMYLSVLNWISRFTTGVLSCHGLGKLMDTEQG